MANSSRIELAMANRPSQELLLSSYHLTPRTVFPHNAIHSASSEQALRPLPLRIPIQARRSQPLYAEPPPVPPNLLHNKPRRTPNHVPIIITEAIKATVQSQLPDSPESCDEESWRSVQFSKNSSRRTSTLTQRARHIPIVIPSFAQPHNPFPPSPPASTGTLTPKDSRSQSVSEEVTSPMRSAVQYGGPMRSQTAESNPSASMESLQSSASRGQIGISPVELPSSNQQQQQPEVRSRINVDPVAAVTESMGATTISQQGVSGATNLSGLMCNVHRTTGREPHGLVGATTTIVGDKLYVFGGKRLSKRRPQLTSDLYELDLIRRHWTKLDTHGDVPPPRYFHSVCGVGDSKMICYGGMSPAPKDPNTSVGDQETEQPTEVIVMSDVHIYDIATRTWELIKTKPGGPQGRYAHCATVLPSSAIFSSTQAPRSAIKHNASTGNPNEGALGYSIDGTGGAEMVVVGGQDSANTYIEQISVFNLRSMEWTSTQTLGRSCGAYRSVVAPLTAMSSTQIGGTGEPKEDARRSKTIYNGPSSMLIYSNYNFLDVKLELQVREPDGSLAEKSMAKQNTPPGLRFPSGGVLDDHFFISGTFLTSSKQEYALWALNLKTLTWTRVDAGNSIFSQGSWNRGVLWPRRNTFVILGNRKRNLIEDYNHRRINFTNICLVELEAFGYYDNPRKVNATTSYSSASAPAIPPSVRSKVLGDSAGGKPHFPTAEELGLTALNMKELADMQIECLGGERIPANSHILSRRWGPYFVDALRNGALPVDSGDTEEGSDAMTLRSPGGAVASRNSSVTITPSTQTAFTTSTNLTGSTKVGPESAAYYPPTPINLAVSSRSRTLYVPHTPLTIHALLHFLYTSSLPPSTHALSTPQILCSLLQIARPYCIDGLLEAVVERLHQVTDGRNAPAVFNASAMAAGGGRGTSKLHGNGPVCEEIAPDTESTTASINGSGKKNNTQNGSSSDRSVSDSSDDNSSIHSSESGAGSSTSRQRGAPDLAAVEEDLWNGDRSPVIGLQKRGLRGLMEGRRLRERGKSAVSQSQIET